MALMSWQLLITNITSLIVAILVLSPTLLIQIWVMVGVPRKLRRAQVVALKYFGPILMVEQRHIKLVTQVFMNQRLHAQ